MVGKSKVATLSEKKRMALIKGLGCVACVIKNWPDVQCEVHHVVEGRVRLGHSQTMGLCLWHHRGELANGDYTRQQMNGMIGPSLAHGSRYFAEVYGSQATLVSVQDYIIQRFADEPWLEFSMPRGVVLDIFYFWDKLRKSDGAL
jgi:hypothetical protein